MRKSAVHQARVEGLELRVQLLVDNGGKVAESGKQLDCETAEHTFAKPVS